ncbi:NAD(P)H-hydrate dehydratase [Martelella lutilitoris]|uniref:Bifunctional NAD(P)H-hydrate repair enzyme n=1 Tax=Martelella lutilitoris TaxID=2583532 RepID=A0A5C4JPE3_9HYPH|nr:NAD(P)H-hydrate dehydratase [Martelella lutilitoris]TNB47218.1 NAD(P)H-hydrate dehydratase [Martelella lutilitoris]
MLLLTPEEMGRADRLAAESGIDSYGLMIRAGHAVSAAFLRLYPAALRADVLCGPGNNGGDGYIAAEALKQAGVEVALFHLGDPENLKGDARRAFQACSIDGKPVEDYRPAAGAVIIDALFGAGLQRPLSDALCMLISQVNEAAEPVIAVDLPSGISGLTGKVQGAAFSAAHTVTFMRAKPGHFLLPGREHCGRLDVFDIGIPQRILEEAGGGHHLNGPDLFASALPALTASSHKFRRGHLGVFSGGPSASGAARLSATAGLRTGAGLVTLAVPPNAAMVVANQVTAVMLKAVPDVAALDEWLEDKRLSAFVLGPGFGVGEKARAFVSALASRPLVLDADGISSFADEPDALFALLSGADPHCVLTPHEGEFARLFPDIAADDNIGKPEKARRAAERANAIVLYKGADTVIAAPDGRIAINANAPPWLATAGSGDVLAGIIGGLLAQGTPAFEAACAGAWLHGQAAKRAGEGLTAEDLPNHLPPLSGVS